MRIVDLQIWNFNCPLIRPLSFMGNSAKIRSGLVLEITTENEFKTWSEISPLPGLHAETLADAQKQLEVFLPQILFEDIEDVNSEFLFSSVRMGVDLAIEQIKAQASRIKIHRFLNETAPNMISIRALLDMEPQSDILLAADAHIKAGFTSLKIKIGRQSWDREIADLKLLRQAFGPNIKIGLDANCRFSLVEAIEFCEAVNDLDIDYIEEPVNEFDDLFAFRKIINIPVALDESLFDLAFTAVADIKAVADIIVIKPSLIGGLVALQQIVLLAKQSGVAVLFTSTFESSLGLWQCANLAAAYGSDVAHGLGTYAWFASDLLVPSLSVDRGQIDVNKSSCSHFRRNL